MLGAILVLFASGLLICYIYQAMSPQVVIKLFESGMCWGHNILKEPACIHVLNYLLL